MDVEAMPGKILSVANAMIGESLLPDFLAADFDPDGMRIAAFHKLDRALHGDVCRWGDQKMHVVGH